MATEEPTYQDSGGEPPRTEPPANEEEIPRGQKFFDNIWLLMVISIGISLILYNVWGLLNLASVPWITP